MSTKGPTGPQHCVSGVYNATPVTLADGQQAPLQMDSAGNILVNLNGDITVATVAISQASPGVSNAVDATNFPVTVDAGSGQISSSSLRTAPGAVAPVATAAATGSLIAKASAGVLYSFSGNSTVSGWFLVFNSTTVPADGTVTPTLAVPYYANQPLGVSYDTPAYFSVGIVIVFSTTGPYTKTISATAFISSQVV